MEDAVHTPAMRGIVRVCLMHDDNAGPGACTEPMRTVSIP